MPMSEENVALANLLGDVEISEDVLRGPKEITLEWEMSRASTPSID
jgi:hypothetical protein